MDESSVGTTLEMWTLALGAVILVLLPLELIWLRRSGRLDRQRVREMVASGIQTLPQNLSVVPIFALWIAIFSLVEGAVPWELPVTWWTVGLAIVLADFVYYWEHRASHRVNVMWASYHSVHHSSPIYDQTTALRLSVLDGLLSTVFYLSLVLIGLPVPIVVGALGVVVAYQTWLHTEMVRRMPRWFEWCFNTPSHHRVHHGSNQEYLDRNYGGILIVWDRLLGTFAPEVAQVRYGLTTQIGTTNWFDVQLFELRRLARSWRSADRSGRWRLLWAPPGTSVDAAVGEPADVR